MDIGGRLLSELVFYRTYPLPIAGGRRETRHETIARVEQMHLDRFPMLSPEIHSAFTWVYSGHVRPSMRSFQFAGEPIIRENVRMFNCAGQALDSVQKFADFLYILMCGTGQGFSVEKQFIANLPLVSAGHEEQFIIDDKKESWADSIRTLIANPKVEFNCMQTISAHSMSVSLRPSAFLSTVRILSCACRNGSGPLAVPPVESGVPRARICP